MKEKIAALSAALLILASSSGPADASQQPDFKTKFYAIGLSAATPAFRFFSVDSLGGGNLSWNPVLEEKSPEGPEIRLNAKGRTEFVYKIKSPGGASAPLWTITCRDKILTLHSSFVAGDNASPFVLSIDQKSNHATLLGLMRPGERRMPFPASSTFRTWVRCGSRQARRALSLDYDARRYVKTPFVRIDVPRRDGRPAPRRIRARGRGDPSGRPRPRVTIRCYDGFRRSFLNLFQVNPRVQMLANNASSDPGSLHALHGRPDGRSRRRKLAEGLTCLDLVRMTLDRYLAGAKGYGLVGYAVEPGEADLVAWKAPWNSLDTYPSLLLAACAYVSGLGRSGLGEGPLRRLAAWARGDDGRRQERQRADRTPAHGKLRRPGHRRPAAVQLVGHDQFRP